MTVRNPAPEGDVPHVPGAGQGLIGLAETGPPHGRHPGSRARPRRRVRGTGAAAVGLNPLRWPAPGRPGGPVSPSRADVITYRP
ncbi:hypothetical protein GCM10017690_32770 [Microbacterium terregens]